MLIGENVWIGGGAIILLGVVIGADAIIGAGAVVTRDVLLGWTVVGNPARLAVRADERRYPVSVQARTRQYSQQPHSSSRLGVPTRSAAGSRLCGSAGTGDNSIGAVEVDFSA